MGRNGRSSGRYAGLGERKSHFFAVISLVWCLMGYYELKFSSHDHSDTKQAQLWSCIGRSRCHGLKLPQPRFWPLCCHNHDSGRYAGLGERKSHFLQ